MQAAMHQYGHSRATLYQLIKLIYSQKHSVGARRGVGDVGHATGSCQLMNDRASGVDNSATTSDVLPLLAAS
jgi:hypothetical protein